VLTRNGWGTLALAAACALVGAVWGSVELEIIGASLFVLVVAAIAYSRRVRVVVSVERQLHPPRVHAGTPSRVELRVRNDGRRRTPVVSIRDAVTGTRGATLLIGPLAPGATASAAYRLPTERRGIVEVGPLAIVVRDPFGLTRLELTASGVTELTVLPRIERVTPIPQTTGNDPLSGADHPNALGRTGEDFYALRPYVVGDDLRRVHWPSTARRDDLMVRQDELPWQGRATLLLDVRQARSTPDVLERMISATASLLSASVSRQDLVRLVTTAGVDSGFAAGHAHGQSLIEHLASLGPTAVDPFDAVVDRLAGASTGGAVVAVVSALEPAEVDRLRRLAPRFGRVLIVQFADQAAAGDPVTGADTRRAVALNRPGVLVVGAHESFADVWNASVRSSGGPRRRAVPATAPPSGPIGEDGDDRWSRFARSRP
jgi:uncharacterized protein (DUF58 family)